MKIFIDDNEIYPQSKAEVLTFFQNNYNYSPNCTVLRPKKIVLLNMKPNTAHDWIAFLLENDWFAHNYLDYTVTVSPRTITKTETSSEGTKSTTKHTEDVTFYIEETPLMKQMEDTLNSGFGWNFYTKDIDYENTVNYYTALGFILKMLVLKPTSKYYHERSKIEAAAKNLKMPDFQKPEFAEARKLFDEYMEFFYLV